MTKTKAKRGVTKTKTKAKRSITKASTSKSQLAGWTNRTSENAVFGR